jgi:hypothetical protein
MDLATLHERSWTLDSAQPIHPWCCCSVPSAAISEIGDAEVYATLTHSLTQTMTIECCGDGSLCPPRLIPTRNNDWNQAVRPGGLLRSSGFQIRDAVPARIPTCVVQLTMQLGPFQLPGSRSGVGGHTRHEWQTRTVTGTWGTRLGNISAMWAFGN